ncbi:MAG: hypothetical protein HOO96_38535 [Polyangiaceae bacterium]|nr:hypothetical protein [Polyangiaceae bacterium]
MPRSRKPTAGGVDTDVLIAEIRSHLDALDLHVRALLRALRAKRRKRTRAA